MDILITGSRPITWAWLCSVSLDVSASLAVDTALADSFILVHPF
jgi:hypothetical protein